MVERKTIRVNVDTCSGCRRCELVCSFAHENRFRPSASRIAVVKEDSWGFDLPVFCDHCEQCPALESCPPKALSRNENGLILVDEEKCSGCGNCVKTCSLGAIRLDSVKHVPLFCDLCGGEPQCVKNCPTNALTYSATEEKQSPNDEVMKLALKRWRMVA